MVSTTNLCVSLSLYMSLSLSLSWLIWRFCLSLYLCFVCLSFFQHLLYLFFFVHFLSDADVKCHRVKLDKDTPSIHRHIIYASIPQLYTSKWPTVDIFALTWTLKAFILVGTIKDFLKVSLQQLLCILTHNRTLVEINFLTL